jgi:hypothetical protein
MEDNEKDILSELESIMNNAHADYDRERHTEHIRTLIAMADTIDDSHERERGNGIYLLAMSVRDAEEMRANGAVTVDGYTPTAEEIERENLTGVKVSEVHFFDDYKQLMRIMSDPEGMVLMHEMTKPMGYLLVRPHAERAMILLDGLVIDNKKQGVISKDYDEIEPDYITSEFGEFGEVICQTVTALQMPQMLKQHKPRMYQAMLEDMKERLEKNDDETDN